MSVSLDGVISGMDTSGLIDAILANSAAPKASMQAQLEAQKATLDKIAGLSNRLKDLSEAIESLQSGGLEQYKATAPEGAGFAAEVEGSVVPGSYTVEVHSLAASEMEVSQGFADADASSIGHGTMQVTIGGVTHDITVDGSNDSLTGLAASLDGVDGVRAYVLDTGDGANPYKLVVQSEEGGAANTIELDTSGLAGGAPTFTQAQAGADAHVSINGIDVYSASNQVEALPGLTLDLNQAGTGPTQLEVAFDPSGVEEQIQAFVDAYNEVLSYYDTNTLFDQEKGIEGALVGESTARRTIESLGSMVSNGYTTGGGFQILAQIGIETGQDGKLSINSETLEDALENSFDDVVTLLTSETGPLSTIRSQIDDVFVDEDSGTLQSRSDSLQSSIEDLEESITNEEERLDAWSEILRSKFAAMEVAMAEMQTTTMFLTSFYSNDKT